MRTRMLWIAALCAVFGGALCAQDISGDWQGALKVGSQSLREINAFLGSLQ